MPPISMPRLSDTLLSILRSSDRCNGTRVFASLHISWITQDMKRNRLAVNSLACHSNAAYTKMQLGKGCAQCMPRIGLYAIRAPASHGA